MDTIKYSAEFTSTTLKIQMLRDEIASDIKNGAQFNSLVPVRARTYFGPKWLDKVLGRMDSMEIFKHSEKDGLIPYDLVLSGMAEAKEEYHGSSHEKRNDVVLYLAGENFEGKVSVLSADAKQAVLGLAWKGSFPGTFINADDIEPMEKEIATLEQRLTKIMQELTAPKEEKEEEEKLEHVIADAFITAHNVHKVNVNPSRSRMLGYAMLGIGLCLTLYSVI